MVFSHPLSVPCVLDMLGPRRVRDRFFGDLEKDLMWSMRFSAESAVSQRRTLMCGCVSGRTLAIGTLFARSCSAPQQWAVLTWWIFVHTI